MLTAANRAMKPYSMTNAIPYNVASAPTTVIAVPATPSIARPRTTIASPTTHIRAARRIVGERTLVT